jgi:hypothetical protein
VKPIVNEVGTRDIWPAMAESITTGYGSAGTYGFRRPLVKDRWHNGAGHGFFLDANFCKKFWIPFLKDEVFIAGASNPESPRPWLQFLSTAKIKYLLSMLALLLVFYSAADTMSAIAQRLGDALNLTQIRVPDPGSIGTAEDLTVALKRIESRKGNISRDEIKRISTDLTKALLTNDSAVTRVVRRGMNREIVGTLLFLNNQDLSHVWQSFQGISICLLST